MKSHKMLAAVGMVALLAVTAACSEDATDDTAGSAATTSAAAAPSTSAMTATSAEFGAGCASVPTDPGNAGSFSAMAKVPVATAASGNPLLKTLVTAVTKANLGDSLNSAQGITVFAPTNDAFGKIPADAMTAVMADNAQLTSILTYHVIPQRLSPDMLAGTFKTLQGTDVTVAGSGSAFTVNGASMVICGNVQTANATVYIVDSVLMPKA